MKVVMKALWQLLFITITNVGKNYGQLKESIRMMKSLRGDTEKINLIKEGQKIAIDGFNSLKFQI